MKYFKYGSINISTAILLTQLTLWVCVWPQWLCLV